MTLNSILAVVIVASFLTAALLSFLSGLLYNDWTGKLFFPVLIVWPGLWIIAVAFPESPIEIRQTLARAAFAMLGIALLAWRAMTLWLQRSK